MIQMTIHAMETQQESLQKQAIICVLTKKTQPTDLTTYTDYPGTCQKEASQSRNSLTKEIIESDAFKNPRHHMDF